ncbi:MAG: tRNA (N6-threonylcarbamoyladenosine(37)-N6)-methyltransferase TrmO [Oscillospiraceae bacterium]|nr:tRNA (N6-threonylcarbamoyladenosine(37)-N6)-methyltransferase TrmO [Oscillospiraceae bacterium]
MSHELAIRPIAQIRTDFPAKFGIPRQAGLVPGLTGEIVFEPEYRTDEALRGLEGFSHIWLIWGFSANADRGWSPTVRPPRLGGNVRMGVFATRSPFRPNGLGLSCVRLTGFRRDDREGTVLLVEGADMLDGTPIYDIKPYVPYADSIPDAACGFAPDEGKLLEVDFPARLLAEIPEGKRAALLSVLAHDPRPQYQQDAGRTYGMGFAGFEIRFQVAEGCVHVTEVQPVEPSA